MKLLGTDSTYQFKTAFDTTVVFTVIRIDDALYLNDVMPDREDVEKDLFEEEVVRVAMCRELRVIRTDVVPNVAEESDEFFSLIAVGDGEWHATYWSDVVEPEDVPAPSPS